MAGKVHNDDGHGANRLRITNPKATNKAVATTKKVAFLQNIGLVKFCLNIFHQSMALAVNHEAKSIGLTISD